MREEVTTQLAIAEALGSVPVFSSLSSDAIDMLSTKATEELYRSAYMEGALTRWARRIRLWSRGGEPPDARRISSKPAPRTGTRDVYCYFDNTDKVEAPANALHLIQKLGVAWEAEPRLKRRA